MVAESIIMDEYEKTMNILFKNKSQNKNKYSNIKKYCLKILKISVILLILNFGAFIGYFTHDFIESKFEIYEKIMKLKQLLNSTEKKNLKKTDFDEKINNNYEKIMELEQLLNSTEKENLKKTDFENDINEKIMKLEDNIFMFLGKKDLKKNELKLKTINDLYEECQVVETIYNVFQSAKCHNDKIDKQILSMQKNSKKSGHKLTFYQYEDKVREYTRAYYTYHREYNKCPLSHRCSYLRYNIEAKNRNINIKNAFGHYSNNFAQYIGDMRKALNNNFDYFGLQYKNI